MPIGFGMVVYSSFLALDLTTNWCIDVDLAMCVVNSGFGVFGDLGIMKYGKFVWWEIVDGGVGNERWIMVVMIAVCVFKEGNMGRGQVLKSPHKTPHCHLSQRWNGNGDGNKEWDPLSRMEMGNGGPEKEKKSTPLPSPPL